MRLSWPCRRRRQSCSRRSSSNAAAVGRRRHFQAFAGWLEAAEGFADAIELAVQRKEAKLQQVQQH